MAYQPPIGSTVAFQSDPTKLLAHASVAGSVTAFQGGVWNVTATGNSSVQVVGVVPTTSVIVVPGIGVLGSVAVLQGTNPFFVQLTSGSVITTGGNSSVQVVGLMPPQSVSGVGQFNVNHNGNGSVLVLNLGSIATAPFPASVSGVGIFNTNPIGSGSVFAKLINSSVTAYQGATPWVTTGSVQGVMSVLGTLPVTGFRNDTLASTLGVDLTGRSFALDSAGRTLTKPYAPEEARIQSVIATNNSTSTSLLAAGGAGLRTYVTDAFVTNTSATPTLVSFTDGDNSVIGRTIAPATGGSNLISLTTPMRTGGFNQIVQVTVSPAVSTLGVTALGYKAP